MSAGNGSDARELGERLRLRERQQEVVVRLGLHGLEETDLQGFLDLAVEEVRSTLDADYCALLELQPDREVLLLRAGSGWKPGSVSSAWVGTGPDSQAGRTLAADRPVIVGGGGGERGLEAPPLFLEHGVRSGMTCPVGGDEGPYGVLGVHARTARDFAPEDAAFLQGVAAVIAGSVARIQTRRRLAFEAATAHALAEAKTMRTAVERIQAAATDALGTVVGELWEPDPGGGLRRTTVHAVTPFTEARIEAELGPGHKELAVGFVGGVFRDGHARWMSSLQDATRYQRVEAMRALGLRSGFVLPVVSGDRTLAVLTSFSTEPLYVDAAFRRSLEGVGRALGDLVQYLDSERRLRTTVEGAPVGICDCSLDGYLLRVNARLCAMTGCRAPDLVGSPLEQIVHHEDRTRALGLLRGRLDRDGPADALEVRLLRPGGGTLWTQATMSLVTKESGEPDYCVAVFQDVSARKRVEEELEESERRARRALLHSPVPTLVCDEDGTILGLSRSWTELTGFTQDELPTMEAWIRLAHGDDAPARLAALERMWRSGGEAVDAELEIRTRREGTRTVRFSGRPIGRTRAGRRLRIVTALDLTERRRSEWERADAARQKDEFIAMLGHELRSPLAAVMSATDLLGRARADDPLVLRARGILERQSAHMARLIDGLLDLTRMVRGRISLEVHPEDLAALVRQNVDDHAFAIANAGLELYVDLPGEPLWVDVDRVRLAQVMSNLLTNAINFTPAPGRVEVELAKRNETGVLTIRDTGVGIDPALLVHLFEPFSQGRRSNDRAPGGLGIGLSLVRRLVELHGGEVEARSDGVGSGAELIVRLPLVERVEEASATAGPSSPTGTPGRRILIIEDHDDAAEALAAALRFEGHEVLVAARGEEGVQMAREARPDIVLCDLGLPGMSGLEVATALRADERTRDVHLVALTGYGREEDRRRSGAAGFDAHLTKPVRMDALQERVLALGAHDRPA